MAIQELQSARQLVEKMDLRHLKTLYEPPMCPKCGTACDRAARDGVWQHCDYSMPIYIWNAVLLHATVLRETLWQKEINTITFHGHPMPVEEAVQPSHLLPVFLAGADEFGRLINQKPMLSVESTDAAADEAGTTLLPFHIVLNDAGCQPTESLMLMVAAVWEAIEKLHQEDPTGSVMPIELVIDLSQILAAA